MSWSTNLWLYFVMVFGIIALPGMDMAFVSASTLAGGLRSGMAALAGIVVGGICHTLMGALGIAVIIKTWPALLQIMAIGGALYFAWIGWTLIRIKQGFAAMQATNSTVVAPAIVFRRAMVTCLINPKAYLFMFAVFPQFLKPSYGPIWVQAFVLGAIVAATQLGVYSSVAYLSSHAGGWMGVRPGASLWMARGVGILFLVVAIFTGMQGWQTID